MSAPPKPFPRTTAELDDWLSQPTPAAVEALRHLPGDLIVLGAGGKMGPTLARMARRALAPDREVFAASRFSSAAAAAELERHGVRTIRCDLLNRDAVSRLPETPNVIFMAGQKFGTADSPASTWMMNAVVPAIVAERYARARVVAFSTGCVYSFVPVDGPGVREEDPLDPPGEYAYSCIARERMFQHGSQTRGTPVTLLRLNYAIDLRYGVLHDVAWKVWRGEPVDVTMGHVNVIWQGDANARALQALTLAASPPAIVNVTGREIVSVRALAHRFGALFQREPRITGTEAGTAWLADASRSFALFGEPAVSLDTMIAAQAAWVRRGGASLGKPTHFETRDGRF